MGASSSTPNAPPRSGYTYCHNLGLIIPSNTTLSISPEEANTIWLKIDTTSSGRIPRSSLPQLFDYIADTFVNQIIDSTENNKHITHKSMSLRGNKLTKFQRRLNKCQKLLKLEMMDTKTITYFVRAARIQGEFLEKQQFLDTISAGGRLVAPHNFKWICFNQFRPSVIDENKYDDHKEDQMQKKSQDEVKMKWEQDDNMRNQARMRARTAIALSDDDHTIRGVRSQQHIYARQYFVDSIKERFAILDHENKRQLHVHDMGRVLLKWAVPSDEDCTRMLQYIIGHLNGARVVTFNQYIAALRYVATNRLPPSTSAPPSAPPSAPTSPSSKTTPRDVTSPTVVTDGTSTPSSITSDPSSPVAITTTTSSHTTVFRPTCFSLPLIDITPEIEMDLRLIFDEIEARTNVRRPTISIPTTRPSSASTITRSSSPSTTTHVSEIPMTNLGKSRADETRDTTVSVMDTAGIIMVEHVGTLIQSVFLPVKDVVTAFQACMEGETFTIYDLMDAFARVESQYHDYVYRLALQHEHAIPITATTIMNIQVSTSTSTSSGYDKKVNASNSKQNLLMTQPRSSPTQAIRRQTVANPSHQQD